MDQTHTCLPGLSSVLPEISVLSASPSEAWRLWTLQTLAWPPQPLGVPQRGVELVFHERIPERLCLA